MTTLYQSAEKRVALPIPSPGSLRTLCASHPPTHILQSHWRLTAHTFSKNSRRNCSGAFAVLPYWLGGAHGGCRHLSHYWEGQSKAHFFTGAVRGTASKVLNTEPGHEFSIFLRESVSLIMQPSSKTSHFFFLIVHIYLAGIKTPVKGIHRFIGLNILAWSFRYWRGRNRGFSYFTPFRYSFVTISGMDPPTGGNKRNPCLKIGHAVYD